MENTSPAILSQQLHGQKFAALRRPAALSAIQE
jgi:hypothetical protein